MNTATQQSHPTVRQWPEMLLPEGAAVTVGRAPSCAVKIQHASVSRLHMTLTRHGPQVEVEDAGSRFGTFVNGARLQRGTLKVGDTLRLGNSPPYRFDGQRLRVDVDAQGMALSLRGVSVVRGGAKRLNQVDLDIPAGEFVGILGPSGAGKSLLLGCISSTLEPSEGEISFDSLPVAEHLDYFRSKVGFVTQEDLVEGSLTVEENLRFAAQIRTPTLSPQELDALLLARLEDVGLQPDRAKRTSQLSGGQRKRLSVAIELLTTPRLLLLDEPTSGLDPHRQATVMEMLRKLSRQGITVVCSTHTFDTLHYFDRVVILGVQEGAAVIAYDAPASGLFARCGVQNAVDLFDRLVGAGQEGLALQEGIVADPTTGTTSQRIKAPSIIPVRKKVTGRHKVRQAQVVFTRALLGLVRDRVSLALGIFQPVALAALVVLSQYKLPRPIFVHFFLVVSALWLGMTLTVREIVRERKLYVRDRLVSLAPDAYLGGKLLCAAMLVGLQALLLWATARALIPLLVSEATNGVTRQALMDTSLAGGFAILWLVGFGGALVGLLISAVASSERAAVALLPLALLPQVLLSRVAAGEGGLPWSEPSPFCQIATAGKYFTTDANAPQGIALLIGSVPMLTRPGTAVLDMLANSGAQPHQASDVAVEGIYLALLLLVHLLAVWGAFRWSERHWDSLLR